MSEAVALLRSFETGPNDAVMDGSGAVFQRVDGLWYRTGRKRARGMTTAAILKQLCPDLADDIDELQRRVA